MAVSRTRKIPSRAPARAAWGWAAAGALAGVLLAAVLMGPAVWVERGINSLSQGRVVLSDSQGTLWAGSSRLTLAGGAGSRDAMRLPGRVQWQLVPSWGQLRVALLAPCCTQQALELTFAPGWSGWSLAVAPGQSTWPAALLTGLGTPWNTLQAEGALVLRTQGVVLKTSLSRWTLDGEVQLDAQDMRSRLSTLRPLGSYRVSLSGGVQPSLRLSTLSGHLQLSGQGRWNAGQLRFEGEASAEPAHAQELSNLLNILGRRDGVRSIITLG